MCRHKLGTGGRKLVELFFITFHNLVKLLYLAIENIGRKSLDFFSKFICICDIFTIFAVPYLRKSPPNQLRLNVLRENGNILFKVIEQCYNQRKQNLEGSRKAA